MFNRIIIRRSLAIFFALVFALGIAPKKILHDIVASHRDTSKKDCVFHATHFSGIGFNCKCDNLVAESPFIDLIDLPADHFVPTHSSSHPFAPISFFSSRHLRSSLRGPPVRLIA